MAKKYGIKMEVGRVKSENRVLKVVGMEMGKVEENEGLKMKNKRIFGVTVKKVSENGRNLMDFGEELKV